MLGAEKGKKNKMNLLFLSGSRLLKYVGQSFDREKNLTGILKLVDYLLFFMYK